MTTDEGSDLQNNEGRQKGGEQTKRSRRTPEERRLALVGKRRLYTVLMWICIFLAILFGWACLGMMMKIGFLPVFDLGYTWFDSHFFSFFGITVLK